MQMLLADVMKGPNDAALEDREIVLDRIGMNEAAKAHIFASGMVHSPMCGELFTYCGINEAFVSHEM